MSDRQGKRANARVLERPRPAVTMAMADRLDASGMSDIARLARKYAVDRPRWWHKLPLLARAKRATGNEPDA